MRYATYLAHHGRDGQKWGVQNGPPYPLDREKMNKSGLSQYGWSSKIDNYRQRRHERKITRYKEKEEEYRAKNSMLAEKAKKRLLNDYSKSFEVNVDDAGHINLKAFKKEKVGYFESKGKSYVDKNGNASSKGLFSFLKNAIGVAKEYESFKEQESKAELAEASTRGKLEENVRNNFKFKTGFNSEYTKQKFEKEEKEKKEKAQKEYRNFQEDLTTKQKRAEEAATSKPSYSSSERSGKTSLIYDGSVPKELQLMLYTPTLTDGKKRG